MKKIILTVLLCTGLFAEVLTEEQLQKAQIGYNIGKTLKANDGMTFEKTLSAMMGAESTWGVEIIGDKYTKSGKLKSLYESSLGPLQIKLVTAKLTIRKHSHLMRKYGYLLYEGDSVYLEYERNKKKRDYYLSIIQNKSWIKRMNNGEMKAIKTLNWAIREYEKHDKIHKELITKAHKDTKLINKLLTDTTFSAVVGGQYLVDMYNHVLRKGWSKPYKRAVGRYNGGWNNMRYANKVLNKMKTINKYIKLGEIK